MKLGLDEHFELVIMIGNEEEILRIKKYDMLNKPFLTRKTKPVRVFNEFYSKEYHSIKKAGKDLNLNTSALSKVARGKIPHCKGYKVEYIKEGE